MARESWCCFWNPSWHLSQIRTWQIARINNKVSVKQNFPVILSESIWQFWNLSLVLSHRVTVNKAKAVQCSMFIPGGVNEVDDEGWDWEDKHKADQDAPCAGLAWDELSGPVLGLGHEVILLASAPALAAPSLKMAEMNKIRWFYRNRRRIQWQKIFLNWNWLRIVFALMF